MMYNYLFDSRKKLYIFIFSAIILKMVKWFLTDNLVVEVGI